VYHEHVFQIVAFRHLDKKTRVGGPRTRTVEAKVPILTRRVVENSQCAANVEDHQFWPQFLQNIVWLSQFDEFQPVLVCDSRNLLGGLPGFLRVHRDREFKTILMWGGRSIRSPKSRGHGCRNPTPAKLVKDFDEFKREHFWEQIVR
jgi:hypothetical protein